VTAKIHQVDSRSFLERLPVLLPSLVWLLALGTSLGAAILRGNDVMPLLPLVGIAAVPGLLGVGLARIASREWVQILLMLSWAALAMLASVTLGFVPMALLFITVPAIACLFKQEKVLEGIIVASLIAAVTWFAGRHGYLPDTPLAEKSVTDWARTAGLAGLLALILASLFSASIRRAEKDSNPTRVFWRDGVKGGIFEYDSNSRLVLTNKEGADQFAGAVPSDLLDFIAKDHLDREAFNATLKAANDQRRAQRLRISHSASGEPASYDLNITPLASDGWLVHSYDRTDEEAQLEILRRTGAMAAQDSTDKTLFFAGVSHELRTPLNAIIGFSDMMRSRLFGPLPGKYAEYADLIHESGQHMLDLIGDVLDLSKVEAGRYELNYDTFDAADVIRSSVKMIRPAADAGEVAIDMNLDLDQALLIQADRRAVRQILLNLLSNAVKFSKKGDHIDVDAQAIDGDLELSVSDEGAGMSAEELARIGEPYTQGEAGQLTAERGSGLGLSLVQSLTQLHGGKMDIKSAVNEGTRVKIILPLQAD